MPQTPKVAVAIAATDQYSAEFIRFRQQIMGVGKELQKLDLPGTRLPKLDTGTGGLLGQIRQQVSSARGEAFSAMRALPGMGTLGALATGSGVVAAIEGYARMGVSLDMVSKQAGTSAAGLSNLRGAARMAGLDANVADQAMTGLNSTIRDAVYGRNGTAANYFRRFGVDIGSIATGAKPAGEALRSVENALHDMYSRDPNAAIRLGSIFGLTPEGVALLARGADEMDRLTHTAAHANPVSDKDIADAKKYAENLGLISTSAEGLERNLVNGLTPALLPLMNGLSGWIDRNSQTEAGLKKVEAAAEAVAGTVLFKTLMGPGLLRRGGIFGLIANAAVTAADPNDDIGTWIDKHVPGASWLDNLASHIGLGRSYAEQGRAGGGGGGGGGRGSSSGPSYSGTVDSSLTPGMRALLDTIAGPESGGRYNVSNGGRTFSDMSHHPGWNGGASTAAGRYQITEPTWNRAQAAIHMPDMMPGSQDKAAAYIAADDYRRRTGRDLNTDLVSPDPAVRRNIARVLAPTWSSMPGGVEPRITSDQFLAELDANRQKYNAQSAPAPAPATPAPTAAAEPEAVKPDLTRGGRIPAGQAPGMDGSTAASADAPQNGRVDVHIHHTNAPADVRLTADADGTAAAIASIRTEHAMPPGIFNPSIVATRGY